MATPQKDCRTYLIAQSMELGFRQHTGLIDLPGRRQRCGMRLLCLEHYLLKLLGIFAFLAIFTLLSFLAYEITNTLYAASQFRFLAHLLHTTRKHSNISSMIYVYIREFPKLTTNIYSIRFRDNQLYPIYIENHKLKTRKEHKSCNNLQYLYTEQLVICRDD